MPDTPFADESAPVADEPAPTDADAPAAASLAPATPTTASLAPATPTTASLATPTPPPPPKYYAVLEDLRGRCLVVVRTARPGRCFGPLVHAAFRGGPWEQRRAATWRGFGALPLAKSDTLRGAFERVVAAAEKAYGFTRDEVVAGFAS